MFFGFLGQNIELIFFNLQKRDKTMTNIWHRVVDLYIDGFRNMTIGRTLWLIILIKLFIIFVILRVFFFPDYLRGKTEQEKQEFVALQLTERP